MLSAKGTSPLKRILTFVFLGVLLAALWIFRDPIRRPLTAIVANNMAARSAALLNAGDVPKAQARALASHNLAPDLYAPLEALFQAARSAEPSSIFLAPAAVALFNHSQATEDIRVESIAALLQAGQANSALYLFPKLQPATRARDDAQLLFADLLLASGAVREARSLLEARLAKGPHPATSARLAQVLLMPAWPPADHDRAHALLAELAAADCAPESLFHTTLRSLATVPVDTLRPALLPPDTADWLDQLPGVSTADALLAARLRLAALPTEQRDSLVTATVDRFRHDPVPLAAWLFNLDRPHLVLALIDEPTGRSSAVLYALRLRAIQFVEGPAASLAWLSDPHPEVDSIEILLTRAACHFQLQDRLKARASWDEIFETIAVRLPPALPVKLYVNAIEQGQPDLAARVLLVACRQPNVDLPPSTALAPTLAYLQNEDRLDDLRTVTEALLQREKQNPILQNNLAYLSFLLGQNEEMALKLANTLVADHPKALPFHTTLALGQLVTNQPAAALQTLNAPGLNWSEATGTDQAIRAKTLERNGQTAEANELRQELSAAQLTDLEKRILWD